MNAQNDIELRWIISVVQRRIWIIAGCAILFGVLAFILTSLTQLTYKASAKILVEPSKDTQSNEYDTLAAAERLAFTYSQMMKNTNVVNAAIKQLGLSVTPEELVKKISAEPIKDTHLILLTVEETSPDMASALANALADAFIQYNQEMQMQKYIGSLEDNQQKTSELKSSIQQAQSQINSLTAEKLNKETEWNDLKEAQIEKKSDFRVLQKNRDDLRLRLQQLEDHVTISDLAQPPVDVITLPTDIVTATLLINQNPVIEGNDYSAILAGERLASTYSQVITSRPVVEAALLKLGLGLAYDDIVMNIRARTVADTLLIKLSVSDPDVSRAASLANAIAEEFISQNKTKFRKNLDDQLAEIEEQMDEITNSIDRTELDVNQLSSSLAQFNTEISRSQSLLDMYQNDLRALELNEEQINLERIQAADSVMLMEPANLPKNPVQKRILTIFLAVIVGSMVGTALAFFLQYMDNRVYTTADVSTKLNLNVLGVIGRREKKDPELLTHAQNFSPIEEQFSILSTRVRNALASDSIPNILLVTSSIPSEGKSFVSANLAVALANAGLEVVLIDADLRQPRIHEIFGIQESKGLADILENEVEHITLNENKVKGLKLLAGGTNHNNPTRVFNAPELKGLFEMIKQDTKLIIVDCPPVLSYADTQILAAHSNATLLVIRSGRIWSRTAQDAKELLEQTGSKIIGVVLNDLQNQPEHKYYYYGYNQPGKITSWSQRQWTAFKRFLSGIISERRKPRN